MNIMKRKRLLWGAAAAVLLGIETLIALFAHGGFIRNYLGDILAVIFVYALIRTFVPEKFPFLPAAIFLLAAAVEVGQYFDYADRLGLGDNAFFRTLLGTGFDLKDIACYAAGCALCGAVEYLLRRKRNKE